MTGRERLNAVLNRQPTDRLPWSTLVDNNSLSHFPEELQGNGGIDFYCHLDCDIFLLNARGAEHNFQSPELKRGEDVCIDAEQEGTKKTVKTSTSKGTLTAVSVKGHPVKYPVDSLEAVTVYKHMWENASFKGHDDTEVLEDIEKLIGDQGIVTRFWGPSTIPRLLELEMGTENFYFLLHDHPEEVESLIHTMHTKELDAFKQLAAGPWESVTLVENTSTFYISPDIYKRFNMPHQRDFVEITKKSNKTAIIHMCGHVRNILDLIKETGCDGIHALTPPPTGDTPWEDALDIIGEDLIILGVLDPSIFAAGPVENIGPALDKLITPRIRESNFVLHPFADGIRVDLDRFYAVKNWIEEKGEEGITISDRE